MSTFTRYTPLEDIRIRSGDGRTVEAYAAVFGVSSPVVDVDGRYEEDIDSGAFRSTLEQNGLRFGVFYNHGFTIHGTPSERASLPLGTPVEVRADQRGLLTVSRYNRTELADEVLESIRNGDIRGQSFSGRFLRSSATPPRGGWRPRADGSLVKVTRMEVALREYGPTPFPVHASAEILGVRSAAPVDVVDALRDLDEDRLAAVRAVLGITTPPAPEPPTADPTSGEGTATPQPDGLHVGRFTASQRAAIARILRKE